MFTFVAPALLMAAAGLLGINQAKYNTILSFFIFEKNSDFYAKTNVIL